MRALLAGVLLLALGLAGVLSLFASEAPDGLEHSMEQLGAPAADQAVVPAPMPEYEAPWFASAFARKMAAGVSGTLIVFGLVLFVGAILNRLKPKD